MVQANAIFPEIWVEIFLFLEVYHLSPCLAICKRWYKLIQGNATMRGILKEWGVYILGGHCNGKSMDSLIRYRPGMKRWAPNVPMPRGLCHCAVTVCDRKVYVFGGRSGEERLRTVLRFDPACAKWETLPPMRMVRSAAVAAVHGHNIYVIGGYDGRRETDTVERFDTVVGKWFYDCAPLPSPISDAAAAMVQGAIYVIGGAKDCGLPTEEVLKSCFKYTPRLNAWMRVSDMKLPRLFPSAVTDGRRIYVMAGVSPNEDGLYQGNYLRILWVDSVEVYDVAANEWSDGPKLLTKRQNPTSTILQDQIFVCGGYFEEPLRTVEMLSLAGPNKTNELPFLDEQMWLPSIPLPEKRDACRAFTLV